MPRWTHRALPGALAALLLVSVACSRGDEDTPGGAASPTVPPGTETTSPIPTGATGSPSGASGLSGSLGETGATGATGDTSATANSVSVTALEYEFRIEGDVPAGQAGFVLQNEGDEPHELRLLQLSDGRTIDDIEALLDEGQPGEPPSWMVPVTGTFAKPGRTSEPALGELESGVTYVIACFIPTKKGIPHAALGMIEEIEVA